MIKKEPSKCTNASKCSHGESIKLSRSKAMRSAASPLALITKEGLNFMWHTCSS